MKQFIIQNKTFLMFVFLLLVIIIFFATKKPKIVTYKSDNKVLEQIQAEQQKQIDYLRFKIDSLNKELIIKKKIRCRITIKERERNIQVYTTGTGTASVDLLSTIQIGKDVTVSDLGNNASTHNIQIDSGVGNTILVAGSSPSQDITLNTNGASITIRKITATQFMVIAKN